MNDEFGNWSMGTATFLIVLTAAALVTAGFVVGLFQIVATIK